MIAVTFAVCVAPFFCNDASAAPDPNDRSIGAPTSRDDADRDKKTGTKAAIQRFDIDEFRIEGADSLPQIEVEEAVYPFAGPRRTADDVEKARAALEKAYASKGYQTVSVIVPQQDVQSGIVVLKVTELKVGRLRVKNSRYFDLDKIKDRAPSLAEGKLPNINSVTKDIYSLNQWPDRKVTPVLRAGVTPGTVDVDLNVEDKLPLHTSVELNNRQSPNTKPLRLNATVHYDNVWQRGDSVSFSYQVAPERRDDVEVFSGSYLARTNHDWLNILAFGVKSNSSVATVGNTTVVGPGVIIGGRAVITLPSRDALFHTLSLGADYKDFQQRVSQGTDSFSTPITYVPLVASYGATWQHEGANTQLNASLTLGLRGLGSDPFEFDDKRFSARSNFAVWRGDLSHTREIPPGFQIYGKVQGQLADVPLVSSEQFSLGGLETVRGYLESETLGDRGIAGTIELRSPSFADLLAYKDEQGQTRKPAGINEMRLFGFVEGGNVHILRPLPEQTAWFALASYGGGMRAKLFDYLSLMLVMAMPVMSSTYTAANSPRVLFRASGEF